MTPAGSLPYAARELNKREVLKEDIYTFDSPKNDLRSVRVGHIANYMLGLILEFDANVECYVERPRILKCGDEIYEFSFWYRERSGRENLALLVPNSATEPALSGQRRHRKSQQLIAAAEQAHLPLRFEFESDLVARAPELTSWHRMLLSVQLSVRMPHRFELRNRIMEVAARLGRIKPSQITVALQGYPQHDLGCVIADLIHAGLLTIDKQKVFSWHSVCEVVQP